MELYGMYSFLSGFFHQHDYFTIYVVYLFLFFCAEQYSIYMDIPQFIYLPLGGHLSSFYF